MRFSVHLLVAALFLVQDVVAAPVAAPGTGSESVALARADDRTTQFGHPPDKQRVSKRTTAKTTAAEKTDTTAAKKTTTTTSTKKTATLCKKARGLPRRLGRRTTTKPTKFLAKDKDTAPDTLDITIGETAFALTKFSGADGNNGVVYQDAAKDFAKTPLDKGDLTKEAEFTKEVKQLKAFGIDECTGTQWLVTKAASGVSFDKTAAFKAATDAEKCTEALKAAADLAAEAAEKFFADFGVNHGDLNPGNVFFNSAGTKVETLIDWGSATTKFSLSFAKTQATFAFKKIQCPSS